MITISYCDFWTFNTLLGQNTFGGMPFNSVENEQMKMYRFPYLPYFPPHISPGPLAHTRFPHLSTFISYGQSRWSTCILPSWQAGGSGLPLPNPNNNIPTTNKQTTIIFVIILIEEVGVQTAEASWRDPEGLVEGREQEGYLAAVSPAQGLKAVPRKEKLLFDFRTVHKTVHSNNQQIVWAYHWNYL